MINYLYNKFQIVFLLGVLLVKFKKINKEIEHCLRVAAYSYHLAIIERNEEIYDNGYYRYDKNYGNNNNNELYELEKKTIDSFLAGILCNIAKILVPESGKESAILSKKIVEKMGVNEDIASAIGNYNSSCIDDILKSNCIAKVLFLADKLSEKDKTIKKSEKISKKKAKEVEKKFKNFEKMAFSKSELDICVRYWFEELKSK